MKTLLVLGLLLGVMSPSVFGQGAQADMVKRRAKELNNQNNVRQGVPTPAQPQPMPAAPAPRSASNNAVTQAQSVAKIQADLVGYKTGVAATDAQKQKLATDLTAAARGPKPTLATVKKFADSLSTVLPNATLAADQQVRLAQNIDAVLNARNTPVASFDKIIEDTQAILEVGTVGRFTAIGIANDLKAIGTEVRR